MTSLNAALLVNLLGFMVGIALYGLLAIMVYRHKKDAVPKQVKNLLLTTAGLGLVWNVGEMFVLFQRDLGSDTSWPFVSAAAYSALGFLPSVVVHSALSDQAGKKVIAYAAYALSILAAVLHFFNASTNGAVPSAEAQLILTGGAIFLIAALLLSDLRQKLEGKGVWAAALLIFAGSSLHFVVAEEGSSWLVEMIAHQSSLPLALAILYQNYKFAFADLFLKRAISLMLLALVAFGLYIGVAAPLLKYHETHDRNDVVAISLILFLWIATALIYPLLHNLAVWLVDKIILNRGDYTELYEKISIKINSLEKAEEIVEFVSGRLASVLTANKTEFKEVADGSDNLSEIVETTPEFAHVMIFTAEFPYYRIVLSEFQGGRRLLSEEITMLESVSALTARRIDALRVTHERCDREFREQEFATLAAEAQLTALRSQINPHFLFNALTTIGYLIQTSPDKAFQTLIHLTKLLRGVLNTTGEFSSLGDEVKLIESYLDIERARFEERLKVEFNIADELKKLKIPVLILQPLVENAIKHGISENRTGGTVSISAVISRTDGKEMLELVVKDTGADKPADTRNWKDGVGLSNIRGRLRSHYGNSGKLLFENSADGLNVARVIIPNGKGQEAML